MLIIKKLVMDYQNNLTVVHFIILKKESAKYPPPPPPPLFNVGIWQNNKFITHTDINALLNNGSGPGRKEKRGKKATFPTMKVDSQVPML